MADRQGMAFGNHEEFDFYLSAFLSAGRSVDYRLRHEQGDAYQRFRDSWDKSLSSNEEYLMKFMVDDRNFEVHESGSGRDEKESRIPVHGTYQDKSGTIFASAPVGTPPVEIVKPTYFFTIGRSQMSVLDCGRKYIELLERLVRDYYQSQDKP